MSENANYRQQWAEGEIEAGTLLDAIDALHAEVEALRAEIEELDALRNRQSDLLSQTAVAVRGPEPALTRYSHADIPSRVKAVVAELEAARSALARVMRFAHALLDDETHDAADRVLTATPAPEVRHALSGDISDQDWINAGCPPEDRQEEQVMGRIHHNPDHAEPVRAVLNSIGRTLPDNAPLYAAPQPSQDVRKGKFKLGDRVRKSKGSQWHGVVVGTYRTDLTPEGYAVESNTEHGSVQIYPAAALELDV